MNAVDDRKKIIKQTNKQTKKQDPIRYEWSWWQKTKQNKKHNPIGMLYTFSAQYELKIPTTRGCNALNWCQNTVTADRQTGGRMLKLHNHVLLSSL